MSEIFAAGYTVSDVTVEFKNCSLCSDTLDVSELKQYSADTMLYYTEISFDGETIYPGGQSAYRREVQFRISLPETAPQNVWDPSNDPSFSGLTLAVDISGCVNIPAYENGAIVWGMEPDGTHFEPSMWQMPDISEPHYNPSGWDRSLFNGTAIVKKTGVGAEKRNFTINRIGGGIKINAAEDLTVGLYTLNGKKIYSTEISRGSSNLISPEEFSGSALIMTIGKKNVKHQYLRCLFLSNH